jgi:hypothetical protein
MVFQLFQRFLANPSEAVETAEGAFGRFFHRAKATVLMRGVKLKNLDVSALRSMFCLISCLII